MSNLAAYSRVFLTFARNSLVRDMTFRGNFIIDSITSMAWMLLNLAFYLLIFRYTDSIGENTGWGRYQFFVFFATGLMINSLVQTFFMTNVDELTDLIRTGGLDFLLLKPIDTQFLVSLRRVEWSSLSNFAWAGAAGLCPGATGLSAGPAPGRALPGLSGLRHGDLLQPDDRAGVGHGLDGPQPDALRFLVLHHDLLRYPMEIYRAAGRPLRMFFTFVIPVLIVVNVPARMLVRRWRTEHWPLAAFTLLATAASVAGSRWLFQSALNSYRSASS